MRNKNLKIISQTSKNFLFCFLASPTSKSDVPIDRIDIVMKQIRALETEQQIIKESIKQHKQFWTKQKIQIEADRINMDVYRKFIHEKPVE